MDALETAAIAVLASLVTAIVSAMLQRSHDRDERIRDRMVIAADDFATGAIQTFQALRDLANPPVPSFQPPNASEARRLLDELMARIARVELLFGEDSSTASDGRDLLNELNELVTKIEKGLLAGAAIAPDVASANEKRRAFQRSALIALRAGTWSSLSRRKVRKR